MRDSVVEFIRLEHNDDIRVKNSRLAYVETLFIEKFCKYKPVHIEYDEYMHDIVYLRIIFKTSSNKFISFNIKEDSNHIHLSLPTFLNTLVDSPQSIYAYEYCKYSKSMGVYERLCETVNIKKENISTSAITMQTNLYLNILSDFISMAEIDKMVHTEFWPSIPFDYKDWVKN